MLVPLILVLVAVAAIVGGLALGRLKLGGPLGVRAAPKQSAPGAPATAGLSEIRIVEARDYDPEGDGQEHPDQTQFAIDGDPATAWSTDHYKSANLGNLKTGVGLWLDLGGETSVSRVQVTSSIVGWEFQVKAGSVSQALSETASATDGTTTFTVGSNGSAVVNLKPIKTSALLIWITQLGQDGGRFGASIGDVLVQGRR
jgi:hypothetical protein